jgi:hypothetical protein
MCDFSRRLAAWLDQELEESEAVEVERHLESCAECKRRLDSYRHVSGLFDDYCESMMEAAAGDRLPHWIRAASYSAAALAVMAAALVFLLRMPVEPLPPPSGVRSAHSIAPASDSNLTTKLASASAARPSSPATKVHHLRPTARTQRPDPEFLWAQPGTQEPGIQVAIPAEAMFPPGAMPAGVTFTADFSVAPDGSVQRLRLQPRLVELQRRSTQP